MVASHASQKDWLEHIFGMSFLEFTRSEAAIRGSEFGVPYAEAFREAGTYPPARTDLPPIGSVA